MEKITQGKGMPCHYGVDRDCIFAEHSGKFSRNTWEKDIKAEEMVSIRFLL